METIDRVAKYVKAQMNDQVVDPSKSGIDLNEIREQVLEEFPEVEKLYFHTDIIVDGEGQLLCSIVESEEKV